MSHAWRAFVGAALLTFALNARAADSATATTTAAVTPQAILLLPGVLVRIGGSESEPSVVVLGVSSSGGVAYKGQLLTAAAAARALRADLSTQQLAQAAAATEDAVVAGSVDENVGLDVLVVLDTAASN